LISARNSGKISSLTLVMSELKKKGFLSLISARNSGKISSLTLVMSELKIYLSSIQT